MSQLTIAQISAAVSILLAIVGMFVSFKNLRFTKLNAAMTVKRDEFSRANNQVAEMEKLYNLRISALEAQHSECKIKLAEAMQKVSFLDLEVGKLHMLNVTLQQKLNSL